MERRIYPRYPVSLPVKLQTKDPKTKTLIRDSGEIVDISLGGVGLSLNTRIPQGTNVALWADLSPAKHTLSTEAQVKWTQPALSNNKFQHGLEFLKPDTALLQEALRDINIQNVESFLDISLPPHVKKNYLDNWISKKLNQEEIMKSIDFTPPFLKIEKFIVFDTYKNSSIVQDKSLGIGTLTREDTKGHYNETIFLAICGQLMGQAASIHLAILNPESAPQVVEVDNIEPIITDTDYLWQPNRQGSKFFVETVILKKKLSLVIVDAKISFGNLPMGKADGGKIFLTPKDSIKHAKELPIWK